MGEIAKGSLPDSQPSEGRLESWKAIAAYLHRDVTTVQRWERREGMPVHRHLHDKAGSVYAYSFELEEWQNSRKLRIEAPEAEPQVAPPAEPIEPTRSTHSRGRLVVVGVVVALVTAGLIAIIRGRSTPPRIRSLAVLPLKNLSGDQLI